MNDENQPTPLISPETRSQTLTHAMLEQNPGLNQVLQFFQEKYGKVVFPDILAKPEPPKAVEAPMTEEP